MAHPNVRILTGNGVITLEEFIEYMSAPPVLNPSDNDLKARFEIFDKVRANHHACESVMCVQDGDGYITKEEMSSIVAELELGRDFPQEVIDAIFSEADANNDGMISLDGKPSCVHASGRPPTWTTHHPHQQPYHASIITEFTSAMI